MGELIERKKRILLNEPHLAVTTPAGVANFSTDMVGKLAQCKVEFSPVQASGTPSPSNVLPISGWTGVNVYRKGMNLIDDSKRYTIGVGYALYFGTTGTGYDTYLKAGTYRFTATMLNNASYDMYYRKSDASAVMLWSGASKITTTTFTLANDGWYRFNMTGATAANVGNCWLTYGESEYPYSAYTGTTYPISWTDQGTVYGGYVDLVTGELVATHSGFTIDQNTTIDGNASGNTLYFSTPLAMYRKQNMVASDGFYCDSFATVTGNTQGLGARCGFISGSTFYSVIYIYNLASNVSEVTDKATGIAYLKNLAPSFTYKLDTPKTYQLTPQQIKTLRGTNNIWSNANGNTTVKYWKH